MGTIHIFTPSTDLAVTFDEHFCFNKHVSALCKRANQNFHALARSYISYTSQGQTKETISAFINSQFGYRPLVWMFHSRKLNNRINKINEKSLRLVYKVKNTSFNELLSMDNSVTVHHRNIRVLGTEIFKAKK